MNKNNCNTWAGQDFLKDSWEQNTGKKFKEPKKVKPLEELKVNIQKAMKDFNSYANNRLLTGAFRYGEIDTQDFSNYDLIQECEKRLELYFNENFDYCTEYSKEKPNLEHIIDAANMLRLCFYWEMKNGGNFKSIDDGVHSQKINKQ